MRKRVTLAVAGLALLLGGINVGPSAIGDVRWTASAQQREARRPERPRSTVEIPGIAVTGRTIRVPAEGDLQKAIDDASGGDLIALDPRATYRGPFRLRQKSGDGWIVIASAALDAPRPGRHVRPADAARMPKIVASSGPVFRTEPGAHHYRLVGLEIAPVEGIALDTLVQLGDDDTRVDTLPHHIIVDRCYLHGNAKLGGRRGIAMNARHTAVVDSYLADFKDTRVDSQAIAGWNGPGPFKIANNYLEAAGENVMFGGGDPDIRDLVPADIEIVRNHMAKPLRWKVGHATFAGTEWSVKNLFELKNARRVLIDGNLFEYNWPAAQNGFAILFTVRNQEGGAPWSVVEDVTFSNNLVRHVAAGINVLGRDDNQSSQQTQRIAIENNVFLDVGGPWTNGRLFQLLDGTGDVSIVHNTAFQTGSILFGGDHAPHTGFVFQNNIAPHNEHGVTGSGTGAGTASLDRYFPGAVVRGNIIVGGKSGDYPRDNFFPPSMDDLGVVGPRDRFQIRLARPYAGGGAGGRDPGADIDAVTRALGGIATVGLQAATRVDADATPIGASSGAAVAFWISLFLLGYVYAGYPLLAGLRASVRPRATRRSPIEPFVSVVVVAHNEADRICARIENLLALDYPRDRLEIVIASDGSTDETVERARRYEDAGVVVHRYVERRGKTAVLNTVVPLLRGDVVMFADARQRFDRRTVRALVENFADATVGAVSGELIIAAGDGVASAGHGTTFYWRYEKFVRAAESRTGSTVCATGAIYAIRSELFEPIPDDTILDDVLIPLRIVRRGRRVLFEPAARAYDSAPATARQELARKARTNAGLFQLFAREPWLLNPLTNPLWFETVSHKALRLALPALHMALLVATMALAAGGEWYRWALAAQLLFYAAALVGYSQRQARRRSIVFSVPAAICLLSWAVVVGFGRFVTNRQQVTWERVAAPVAAAPALSDPRRRAS